MIRSRFNTYDERKTLTSIEHKDNNQGYVQFFKSRAFLESISCSASTLVEELEKAALKGDLESVEDITQSFFVTLDDAKEHYIPKVTIKGKGKKK